jgi:pyruvate/2-oxoacid:ferredoxin oxidoreductase alpha subunit
MCDLTMLAFDLADKYRTPVYVLTDGFIGQMMEPVEFPESIEIDPTAKSDWAIMGTAETKHNLINSIYLEPEEMENPFNLLKNNEYDIYIKIMQKFKEFKSKKTLQKKQ